MKPEEYVKTLVIYGRMVNIGMDDYGQQYFLEYLADNGELTEVGCGAYETDYVDFAKSFLDYRRYLIEKFGEEEVIKMEKEREERMKRRELNGTSI